MYSSMSGQPNPPPKSSKPSRVFVRRRLSHPSPLPTDNNDDLELVEAFTPLPGDEDEEDWPSSRCRCCSDPRAPWGRLSERHTSSAPQSSTGYHPRDGLTSPFLRPRTGTWEGDMPPNRIFRSRGSLNLDYDPITTAWNLMTPPRSASLSKYRPLPAIGAQERGEASGESRSPSPTILSPPPSPSVNPFDRRTSLLLDGEVLFHSVAPVERIGILDPLDLATKPQSRSQSFESETDERIRSKPPLLRSNTYEVLESAVFEECLRLAEKESAYKTEVREDFQRLMKEEKEKRNKQRTSSVEMELEVEEATQPSTSSAGSAPPTPASKDEILLSIRLPTGQRLHGYFHRSDSLRAVLEYAEMQSRQSYDEAHFIRNDLNAVYKDLERTIDDIKLKNRTLLTVKTENTVS